jgi:hypothetical protein
VLLLHFSLAVSRLSDQSKVLAQRLALVEQRLEETDRRARRGQRRVGTSSELDSLNEAPDLASPAARK